MVQATKPVEMVVQAIQALDLDPIKMKLMDAEEGQGWSREYTDRMELAYKRFLTLLVKYPHETIAPSKDIDKFWHGHILDTMKYAEDCEQVFGYFLHHFPYFGMRGEEDAANLRAASTSMHTIYEREFGESMPQSASFCVVGAPAAKADSAFCVVAEPSVKTDSAFCVVAKPTANVDSAFYVAAKPSAKADSAFCVVAKPTAKADSAFCVVAKPSAEADSAFCVVARPPSKVDSAFCVVAKPTAKVDSAFCVVAKPSAKADSAFCVVARPSAS